MEHVKELKKLNIKQRISAWGELWESIIRDVDLPVSKEEKEILQKRYENFKNNPDAGRPWTELYDELRAQS